MTAKTKLSQQRQCKAPQKKVSALVIAVAIYVLTLQSCVTVKQAAVNPEEAAKARTGIAAQYIRRGELDDAKRHLEKAFAANSKYAPAYDLMGVLLQQEGSQLNLTKAESYFKKAIRLQPDFAQAHNNYGVYLSKMQRYSEAVKQFEIAAASLGYEGRASSLENLGRTYLQLNNPVQAKMAFIRALEVDKNSVISRVELVDILLGEGNIPIARSFYDEYIQMLHGQALDARSLFQGIKLAHAIHDNATQRQLSRQLFNRFPLSDEAKQLRILLRNPEAVWK